jgi:hypothetical protein
VDKTSIGAALIRLNHWIGIGTRDIFHALILTLYASGTLHNSWHPGGAPFHGQAETPSKINVMEPFTEKNLDALHNLEFCIVDIYRDDPSLLDLDAKDAIDAAVRHYRAEEEQRRPPAVELHDRAQRVFSAVQEMCEWRLGRIPLASNAETNATAMPISELVDCLKQIQKSIPRWSKQGGRQGYLNFVRQYVR